MIEWRLFSAPSGISSMELKELMHGSQLVEMASSCLCLSVVEVSSRFSPQEEGSSLRIVFIGKDGLQFVH